MRKKRISDWILVSLIIAIPAFDFSQPLGSFGLDFNFHGQRKQDVKVISNPKTPRPPSGKPISIIFSEELSIGMKEGDENYMFGERVYFNVDKDGNFYVTDWDRKRIQKYDPRGKYLTTIGRPGQGPGEFKNVWRVRFDKDGNLYVADIAAYRISFFDKKARFLRQIKIPISFSPHSINSKGLIIGSQTIIEENPTKFTTVYGLFDEKFYTVAEFQRTVWAPKESGGSREEALVQSLANNVSDLAFKPRGQCLEDGNDCVWFGYPENYEIRVYNPEGRLDRIIRREYDPRPVTAKDKERFIAEQETEFFRFLPEPAKVLKNKIIDRIKFPKAKPAYSSFSLMENGWLAVMVETADNGDTIFDLFDESGRYIAHFPASVSSQDLFFKNGKAYAIVTEDGYKFVKRYNLRILSD